MADFDFNAFDRPDVGGARGAIFDDTPLVDYTPDDTITTGGDTETSFINTPGGPK